MNPAPAPQPAAEKQPAALSLPDQRKEARDQLSLVLSFFSRVDSKASALLAIDTGMLAILSSNAPPLAGNDYSHAPESATELEKRNERLKLGAGSAESEH